MSLRLRTGHKSALCWNRTDLYYELKTVESSCRLTMFDNYMRQHDQTVVYFEHKEITASSQFAIHDHCIDHR
jgi:hypothetical protein